MKFYFIKKFKSEVIDSFIDSYVSGGPYSVYNVIKL